jgi:polyphosphate kinase
MSEPLAIVPSGPAAAKEAVAGKAVEHKTDPKSLPTVNLTARRLYLNREISWLEFNRRVLEEALDDRNPLLERVKFLAIFASNLDEFFMIRVSGLRRQLVVGTLAAPADGMSPAEQLAAIRETLVPMLEQHERCWAGDLMPRLADEGIRILRYGQLKARQRRLLRRHFEREIFPVLTPLAFDPSHPFPHISNLSVNLAVVVRDPEHGERFARLKVPGTFPRFLRVPDEESERPDRLGLEPSGEETLVFLEEVVAANLDLLFPGLEVVAAHPFRITRDADFEIEEDEAADLLEAMETVVGQRFFGSAVRLEIARAMPSSIRDLLVQNLGIQPYQVYTCEGPLGLGEISQLCGFDRPDLKDPRFQPAVPAALSGEESIFTAIQKRPILLYHPYDSFTPVVDFLREAARDRDVLAIKQTLYRVGANSPIVEALMEARENGKQVAVLVELKARFDEQNNIVWARALERAGVHVVYGLVGLKTHAKLCMVVRKQAEGLIRYVHVATGNYNPATARAYTDLGYFSCDPELASDVADLFNSLTGYSRKREYRKLVAAPHGMRQALLSRIEREIEAHREQGGGHIAFKMNALVDKACIRALYRASQAGVRVDLQVRGICCLRPGLERVSETIEVTSIVGRFLEHSRMYWFRNGGDDEVLIGSADLMPRNLDGRVEVLVPIDHPELKATIRDEILFVHLEDNVRARRLRSDGGYDRLSPGPDEAPRDTQALMLARRHG